MNVYTSWDMVPSGIKRVVTIGNFDGVHLGHQAILRRVQDLAEEQGLTPLVVTFSNHTSEVVRHAWPPMLMDVEERLEAIAAFGIEEVLLLEFTESLAHTAAETFLDNLIGLGAQGFVVGHDFRCGAGGTGDTEYLMDFVERHGLGAEIIPAVRIGGIVSSTRIRRLIVDGRIEDSRQLLGRPFRMGGIVSHGEKRGRTLGFPTANLAIGAHRVVPRFGVYLVGVTIEGGITRYGLGNVGVKPTFQEQPPLIEVYILDFNGDVYGRRMEVDFLAFLRPERRFNSGEELVVQMKRDVAEGRELIRQKGIDLEYREKLG